MKLITEKVYRITYKLPKSNFESDVHFIADSLEEAIALYREQYKDGIIREVKYIFDAKRNAR